MIPAYLAKLMQVLQCPAVMTEGTIWSSKYSGKESTARGVQTSGTVFSCSHSLLRDCTPPWRVKCQFLIWVYGHGYVCRDKLKEESAVWTGNVCYFLNSSQRYKKINYGFVITCSIFLLPARCPIQRRQDTIFINNM